MSNFIKIVRHYEKVYHLGKQIIDHKTMIKKCVPQKLDEEFLKQEERIQNFCKITKQAETAWKRNPSSINKYWTGWD